MKRGKYVELTMDELIKCAKEVHGVEGQHYFTNAGVGVMGQVAVEAPIVRLETIEEETS